MDETPRVASFYRAALHRSNAGYAKREEGVNGSTLRQSARAHAAQRHSGKRAAWRAREMHLSVRQRRGGELDRGASGCPRGAMKGASAPCLRDYARAATELHRGLDGALMVTLARPAGLAVQGFIVELLAGHPGWSSDGRQQSSDQRRRDAPRHEEAM
jgi:hypothetical protein